MGAVQELEPLTKQYVDLQEASQLGYGSYQTLRLWINEGRLPAYTLGNRRVKIRVSDLEAMLVPKAPSHTDQVINAAVQRIVASAPRLSNEQRTRLRAILSEEGA